MAFTSTLKLRELIQCWIKDYPDPFNLREAREWIREYLISKDANANSAESFLLFLRSMGYIVPNDEKKSWQNKFWFDLVALNRVLNHSHCDEPITLLKQGQHFNGHQNNCFKSLAISLIERASDAIGFDNKDFHKIIHQQLFSVKPTDETLSLLSTCNSCADWLTHIGENASVNRLESAFNGSAVEPFLEDIVSLPGLACLDFLSHCLHSCLRSDIGQSDSNILNIFVSKAADGFRYNLQHATCDATIECLLKFVFQNAPKSKSTSRSGSSLLKSAVAFLPSRGGVPSVSSTQDSQLRCPCQDTSGKDLCTASLSRSRVESARDGDHLLAPVAVALQAILLLTESSFRQRLRLFLRAARRTAASLTSTPQQAAQTNLILDLLSSTFIGVFFATDENDSLRPLDWRGSLLRWLIDSSSSDTIMLPPMLSSPASQRNSVLSSDTENEKGKMSNDEIDDKFEAIDLLDTTVTPVYQVGKNLGNKLLHSSQSSLSLTNECRSLSALRFSNYHPGLGHIPIPESDPLEGIVENGLSCDTNSSYTLEQDYIQCQIPTIINNFRKPSGNDPQRVAKLEQTLQLLKLLNQILENKEMDPKNKMKILKKFQIAHGDVFWLRFGNAQTAHAYFTRLEQRINRIYQSPRVVARITNVFRRLKKLET